MLNQSTSVTNKVPRIFPKLFIGSAKKSFESYLKKNKYGYKINYISDRDDLISFIETYSAYKDYNLPVIISDISFLNKNDQSLLLKFMDDSKLKIILLASRDNILDTIISRVREFRKFYVTDKGSRAGFINVNKAREMFNNDYGQFDDDTSEDDKLLAYNQYNPVLAYNNNLVKKYRKKDQGKLLSLLEFNYE